MRNAARYTAASVHSTNEVIDEVFSVARLAALDEVLSLLLDAVARGVEFERPEEVVGLLEMRTYRPDLVHQILHTDNVVLTQDLEQSKGVSYGDSGGGGGARKLTSSMISLFFSGMRSPFT